MNENYLVLPEMNQVEPHLDVWLYETQRIYENATTKYIKFKEAHITAQIDYDKAIAENIARLRGQETKVTIVKEMAKALCSEQFEKMQLAEAQKRKYDAYIKAMESRINMLKYLMKRKYGEMS